MFFSPTIPGGVEVVDFETSELAGAEEFVICEVDAVVASARLICFFFQIRQTMIDIHVDLFALFLSFLNIVFKNIDLILESAEFLIQIIDRRLMIGSNLLNLRLEILWFPRGLLCR